MEFWGFREGDLGREIMDTGAQDVGATKHPPVAASKKVLETPIVASRRNVLQSRGVPGLASSSLLMGDLSN